MADDDKKRPLGLSEKAKNYGLAIGAASALILGLVNSFRGEPKAERTYAVMRDQVNALTDTVNTLSAGVDKLAKRVVFLQAHEEGRTAALIQLKLEKTEKELSRLKSPPKPILRSLSQLLSKPSKPACRDGFVLVDGRCRHAHKAVAKKLAKQAAEKEDTRRLLTEEKKKRREAERRKKTLIQQLILPHQNPAPPKLPRQLDEEAK